MTNGSGEKLTLSDWITFLSGESTPAVSNILSLAAFLLAAFAIVLATTQSINDHSWMRALPIAEFGIIVVSLFIVVTNLFKRHAGKAENLLYRIMRGELKDPSEIQSEWKGEKNTKNPQEIVPTTEKKSD